MAESCKLQEVATEAVGTLIGVMLEEKLKVKHQVIILWSNVVWIVKNRVWGPT